MATVKFTKIHTANRGYSTYKAEGFPGVLLMAKPAFNGTHPDSIEVGDVPDPVAGSAVSRAKMTPEEKKAKAAEKKAELAKLTPAQRAEQKLAAAKAAFDKAAAKAKAIAEKDNAPASA